MSSKAREYLRDKIKELDEMTDKLVSEYTEDFDKLGTSDELEHDGLPEDDKVLIAYKMIKKARNKRITDTMAFRHFLENFMERYPLLFVDENN